VAFVVDDLVAWLVGLLADAGRKKLTALVLGSDQERALGRAATAAIQLTVTQLIPPEDERAEQLAMVVSEVFRGPPGVALAGQGTILEALQAGIAAKVAVLDDPGLTGTGQSSAEGLGVSGSVLAEALAGHLIQEIMLRGSVGGPLAPLADQLNHDVTHMQGQRIEGVLAQLVEQVIVLGRPGVPVVPGKPVRLLPRPAFLAGREDLLADLDARLTSGKGSGPRMVALSGMGGAGKTSLAVEYAHRHLGDVGLAWQFPAEDTTVLAAGFTDLAARLVTGGVGGGGGDPVAAVHSVLAAYPREWLLVFDNVPGPEQVQDFLPPAGDGRVLITSRNALWPPKQAVEVPVLDADVASGFLVDRTGDPDEPAARALAGELGGLPLALEQAAAYAQATGNSLAAYLALLRQRRGDLLARGPVPGYGGTIATTWALAFGQLQDSAPGAAGLLRLLACCAPEAVPLRLLLRPPPGRSDQLAPEVAQVLKPLLDDELAAGDAIAALRRYSLVRPAGDGAASAHRLVQAVTADQMPGQLREAWRQAAATLVDAALPREPRQPDTWPVFAALLPHAQAVLPPDNPRMEDIASYLGYSGGYAAARDFSQTLVEERAQVLGPDHRGTLAAHVHFAFWTGRAGDAAGARDQLAALLPIIERVLGPEDAYTLADRGILARFTGEAGDAAGARDQLAALLPIQEKVRGPEDPYTLITRGKLAAYTGEAGDAAGARDQFAALLLIRERVLGPGHPSTLTTRSNLARFTGEAGDAAGARDQSAALLPIIERVLGPEHPNALAARDNLARWTREVNDDTDTRRELAAGDTYQARGLSGRSGKSRGLPQKIYDYLG
jgi:hypothetical protein